MYFASTFFLCRPKDLLDGFPGWKLPLPAPVSRQIANPRTGEPLIITTRCPEWTTEEREAMFGRPSIEFQRRNLPAFLEERLRPFVRARPHWCTTDINPYPLDALANVCGLNAIAEGALYHRLDGLYQFDRSLLQTICNQNENQTHHTCVGLAKTLQEWEFLQGDKEWDLADATRFVTEICKVFRQSEGDTEMYLLIEL